MIFGSGISTKIFSEPQFWYYYNQVNKVGFEKPKNIGEVDVASEIKNKM